MPNHYLWKDVEYCLADKSLLNEESIGYHSGFSALKKQNLKGCTLLKNVA